MMRKITVGIFGWLTLGAIAACVMPQLSSEISAISGQDDFNTLCAPCHGTSGQGNGPLAGGLDHPPADLTGLSARHKGTFPMPYVLHKIWGYAEGQAPMAIMPKFGPLRDSPIVLFDAGDGIQTPTPEKLVDLANYVSSLQR